MTLKKDLERGPRGGVNRRVTLYTRETIFTPAWIANCLRQTENVRGSVAQIKSFRDAVRVCHESLVELERVIGKGKETEG